MAGKIFTSSNDSGANGGAADRADRHSLIRSKYLTSLGIHQSRAAVVWDGNTNVSASHDDPDTQRKKDFLRGVGRHRQTRRSSTSVTMSPPSREKSRLIRDAVPFSAPLNDAVDYENQQNQQSQPSISFGGFSFGMSLSSAPPPPELPERTTKLRFSDEVTVVPIPSRYQYSNRIAAHLWTSSRVIHEQAERNMYEFQCEGWDYKTVVDDLKSFYVDAATGELVHPCWLEGESGYKIVGEDVRVEEDDTESLSSCGSASSAEDGAASGPPVLKRTNSMRFDELSLKESETVSVQA